MDSLQKRRIFFVVIVVAAAILAVGGTLFTTRKASESTEAVNITYSTADTTGTSVKFNNEKATPVKKNNPTQFKLKPGSYTATIERQGYQTFTTKFTLEKGRPVLINAQLKLDSDPTITSVNQLNLPDLSASNLRIQQISYFYDKTWAAITLQADGSDPATAIVQYDAITHKWNTALGPGTSFAPTDVENLPELVQAYISANSLANPGGSGYGY